MNKKIQIKIQNIVKVFSNTTFISKSTGFTLIELVVSLGLFIVVMMISTGALLSLSATNEKVSSMRIGMDNLNLALESISREIRMGTVYNCDYGAGVITDSDDCSFPGADSFTFLSKNGEQTVYRLNNNRIERSKNGGSTFDLLTAPEITITSLKFMVFGAEGAVSSVPDQPRVVISINGISGLKEKSKFNMQTMVTQKRPK